MSSEGNLIGNSILVAGFGLALIWSALKAQRKNRIVEDTATAKLSGAALGLTEVQGFAWPNNDKWFDSRGGQRLVYYSMALQKEVTEGFGKNRRKTWETVYSWGFMEPFYVLDPTGLAQINTVGADLNLSGALTTNWRNFSKKDQDFFMQKVIANAPAKFPPSNFLFGLFSSKFQIIESEMPCGSPIYVCGQLVKDSAGLEKIGLAGLTDFAKKVINFDARTLKNVNALLDKNNDGKISESELSEGYVAAAQMSCLKSKTLPQSEQEFEIFGRFESTKDTPLMVADTFQEQLTKRLGKQIYWKFAGGLAFMAVSILMILAEFGQVPGYRGQAMANQKQPSARTEGQARNNSAQIPTPAPSARTPTEEVKPTKSVAELHKDCLGGQAEDCEHLITKKNEYKLTEQYVTYYKQKACLAGRKAHCN